MRKRMSGLAIISVRNKKAMHVIAESMIDMPIFHGNPGIIECFLSIIPP